MSTKRERQREIVAENRRLRAAVGAVHDLLHRGEVDAAHEACECAMTGGDVSQPSLTVADTAKGQAFAAEFNALLARLRVRACAISIMPVVGATDRVSLQMCGDVDVCKLIEAQLSGGTSLYMGDHKEGA